MKKYLKYLIPVSLMPVVLFIDYLTPLGISDGMLYLPGVVYMIMFRNKKLIFLYTALCTCAIIAGIFISPDEGVKLSIYAVNRIYSIIVIWLVAFFTATQLLQKETINTLSNMITMSAWNKQVKYRNEWISIEEYLKKELGITVSHSIDPESAAQMMRDAEALKKE